MPADGFATIQEISESKLIPSRAFLRDYDSEDLAELAFIHILSLRILLDEPVLKPFPQFYCRKTIRYGNFTTWHIDSTDLYVMLYGLISNEAKYDSSQHRLHVHMPVDALLLYRWLRAAADQHLDTALTHRLFVRLDTMFRVKNSSLRAIRRLVMDWDEITTQQRRLALTRLLQFMRTRAPKGELLAKLNRVAVLRNLEIDNVANPETGEEKPGAILRDLERRRTPETATAGATSAGNIASVPGGLGAGFDDDHSKSVYPPPKIIRRRKVIVESESGWRHWLTDDPAQIAPYIAQARQALYGFADFDATVDASMIADLGHAQITLLALIAADHSIEVWRAMKLYPLAVAELDIGAVGRYFTYRQHMAIAYDAGRAGQLYRLHADLPAAAVDWVNTLAVFASGDCEITAKDGQKLICRGVDQINSDGRVIDTNIRPELVCQTLRTGPMV
jgi:hypothetical protein